MTVVRDDLDEILARVPAGRRWAVFLMTIALGLLIFAVL